MMVFLIVIAACASPLLFIALCSKINDIASSKFANYSVEKRLESNLKYYKPGDAQKALGLALYILYMIDVNTDRFIKYIKKNIKGIKLDKIEFRNTYFIFCMGIVKGVLLKFDVDNSCGERLNRETVERTIYNISHDKETAEKIIKIYFQELQSGFGKIGFLAYNTVFYEKVFNGKKRVSIKQKQQASDEKDRADILSTFLVDKDYDIRVYSEMFANECFKRPEEFIFGVLYSTSEFTSWFKQINEYFTGLINKGCQI